MTRCINLVCEFYFHGPAWLPGRVRKAPVQLVCWFWSLWEGGKCLVRCGAFWCGVWGKTP